MEHFYNEHHIRVSVSEAFPGWVANLFISYREGVESRVATFMLDQIWATDSQAIEAGLATAKHWIDTGKP
jgi:hypothetical protein